jgi:hypothetical protein
MLLKYWCLCIVNARVSHVLWWQPHIIPSIWLCCWVVHVCTVYMDILVTSCYKLTNNSVEHIISITMILVSCPPKYAYMVTHSRFCPILCRHFSCFTSILKSLTHNNIQALVILMTEKTLNTKDCYLTIQPSSWNWENRKLNKHAWVKISIPHASLGNKVTTTATGTLNPSFLL